MRLWWACAVAAVGLLSCEKRTPGSIAESRSPDASTMVRSWNGWSPSAAIETCVTAVDAARVAGPRVGSAGLLATCCSLIGGARCRAAAQKHNAYPRQLTLRETVEACANEYCPRLPDAASLAACDRGNAIGWTDEGWVALSAAMLRHDFPAADLPRAAHAALSAAEYVKSIPPPTMASERAPPDFEVLIKSGGVVAVLRDGKPAGEPVSLDDLKAVLPKRAGGGRVVLHADTAVDHADVMLTMDVLRELGYEHISFAVRR
jgi:biopolymer transport protein ExbD